MFLKKGHTGSSPCSRAYQVVSAFPLHKFLVFVLTQLIIAPFPPLPDVSGLTPSLLLSLSCQADLPALGSVRPQRPHCHHVLSAGCSMVPRETLQLPAPPDRLAEQLLGSTGQSKDDLGSTCFQQLIRCYWEAGCPLTSTLPGGLLGPAVRDIWTAPRRPFTRQCTRAQEHIWGLPGAVGGEVVKRSCSGCLHQPLHKHISALGRPAAPQAGQVAIPRD